MSEIDWRLNAGVGAIWAGDRTFEEAQALARAVLEAADEYVAAAVAAVAAADEVENQGPRPLPEVVTVKGHDFIGAADWGYWKLIR